MDATPGDCSFHEQPVVPEEGFLERVWWSARHCGGVGEVYLS